MPILSIVVFAMIAGCNGNESPNGLPTVKMNLGGTEITLEVAATPEARENGLMRRDSMPQTHGMLFVFPTERQLGFWMKNTRINLDIVYIDAAGRIVSIHRMEKFDRRTVDSEGPAKYAIELNEGMAGKLKLEKGQKLEIPKEYAATER